MATLSRGGTFGATETVTNTKLHNLVDLGSISGINNADCASDMNLSDTKLADITSGGKVRGSALLNLSSTPSGAGTFPAANIPNLNTTMLSLVSIPNSALQALVLASLVDGMALRNLCSTPVDTQFRYNALVASMASGAFPQYNGSNNFVGRNIRELFLANATFVAPPGVTRVFVTMCGGGGGGGDGDGGSAGGGGGGGASIIHCPFAVTPGNGYGVVLGAGGTTGGGTGGTSTFGGVLTALGGTGGQAANPDGAGGAGGAAGLNAATTTAGVPGGIAGGTGGTRSGGGGAGGASALGKGAASNAAASANTGGGGGGGDTSTIGSVGGSGICVIEY